MAYNPAVIFPETLSQGASFGIGFDTNILSLENGSEFMVPRMAAWGRRKYNVARNSMTRSEVNQLMQFYVLRGGSRDSFKFKDWLDYATTTTGYVDATNQITPFDVTLQLVSGQVYQCVRTISDAGGSVVRPIEKIKASTFRCAVNGTEVFSPGSFTLNAESGQVTFSSGLGAIATATAGFEYYVVVRFAAEADQNFEALLGATQASGSIPAISLIEDVSRTQVTQYQFFGGSFAQTVPTGATENLSMLNGLFQSWSFASSTSHLQLPDIDIMPTGGPVFILYPSATTGSNVHRINTSSGALVGYMNLNQVVEMYVFYDASGVKTWIAAR